MFGIRSKAAQGALNAFQSNLLINHLCEALVELGCHAPLYRIGVEDVFTESGASWQVKEKYGLHVENVINKIESILK